MNTSVKCLDFDTNNITDILNILPIGVFITSSDKFILYINEYAQKIFGMESVDEALNRVCHKYICPSLHNNCPIWDLNHSIDQAERVIITKDRGHVSVIKSCIPIRFKGHSALLEVFQDITTLKQLQEERDELKNEVNQHLKMSTLGTIASSLIHEINNPVTVIMGYAQILSAFQHDEKCKSHATSIVNAARRLEENVTNLSRFIKKDPQMGFVPTNITMPIHQGVSLLQRMADKRGIKIRIMVEPTLPPILSGKSIIESIIINLLQNSFDAYDDNQVSSDKLITIGVRNENNYVVLEYQDNAGGMDDITLANIYKPFYTTKPLNKGTGLGMHIVQTYVKEMNGIINVYSQKQIGSTFEIKLPIYNQQKTS